MAYDPSRGLGWDGATFWRVQDVLQPEPLYQDFLCIEGGSLKIDLPNGEYHVFLNIDNPSGYWGEFQRYESRQVYAEGHPIVDETMDFDSFKAKYFRHWNTEDTFSQDTWAKYQGAYYDEKEFDVTIIDGTLDLEFYGKDWANSICCLVLYPADQDEAGSNFLDTVRLKRGEFFDQSFQLFHPVATQERIEPTLDDFNRGYRLFRRHLMEDVLPYDEPKMDELNAEAIKVEGFPGELEPFTLSLEPLSDLGQIGIQVSDLEDRSGAIPSDAVDIGWVSYRLSRVTMDGAVYTISPRFIMPESQTTAPEGMNRRLWFRLAIPPDTSPGTYRGKILIQPEHGSPSTFPLHVKVLNGQLPELDIAAGPWGYNLPIPWYASEMKTTWDDSMAQRCFAMLRSCGLTSFSGLPFWSIDSWQDGEPVINYHYSDLHMQFAREAGFYHHIINYVLTPGFNMYRFDRLALYYSKLDNYQALLKAIFGKLQAHISNLEQSSDPNQKWLPVFWNLGDEPLGGDLESAIANAQEYRNAFPEGPPYFTLATSAIEGMYLYEKHLELCRLLHVPNLNAHDEASIDAVLEGNTGIWGMYNSGNRYSFGRYMFAAAQKKGLDIRLSWHWNLAAGDPFYALDCREDDYSWVSCTPEGQLIRTVKLDREITEGVDDYRRLLAIQNLSRETGYRTAAQFIQEYFETTTLSRGEETRQVTTEEWDQFRSRTNTLIEKMVSILEKRK